MAAEGHSQAELADPTAAEQEAAIRAGRVPPVPPVIGPGHTYATVTDHISAIVLTKKTPMGWVFGFAIAFTLFNVLMATIIWLLYKGIGIWGNNQPIGWAWDITNFVWWIGIGHAGTLISAILLLFKQEWRTSINRFAEAMTLFAVACAGLFPLLHTGRPWRAYWMLPYPNTMGLLPQFRSPLEWDVWAVSTYATVSAIFWYVGLIPDLATLRDRAKNKFAAILYGMGAMGWRGSAIHWHRYEMAYLLLAGLSTPLVLSVHTVVSFDFAIGQLPGWHTTVFPPYFVAGAVFSGFAMVLTLAIPIRKFYKLEDFITTHHLHNMAKVMLATGLIVAYGYGMEAWLAFYSDNVFESRAFLNRFYGSFASPYYWALILCNIIAPQLLWFRWVRDSVFMLFILSIVINIGMWLERFVIIVLSLHHDFLPSSWEEYHPTIFDWSMYLGSIGLFLTLIFLFIRFLPVISVFELRELVMRKRDKRAPVSAAGGPGNVGDIEPGTTGGLATGVTP
jgi:Ni/Fe-hydrogenase subunit HybB-like protein